MSDVQIEKAMESLVVLVADANAYTRRLTRTMLTNLGVKAIYEAFDGIAALDAIRNINPDVMILEWNLPATVFRSSVLDLIASMLSHGA